MKAQHTPGPWKWSGVHGRSGGVIEDASGDLLIADLVNADNAAGNGPVLAAASEMLEALRDMVRFADRNGMFIPTSIAAAIAKATGEEV